MAAVLIVEDYPTILKLYAMAFERAGHIITEAATGQEALDISQKQKFDLILLDILLPEVSGIEFLRKFKAAQHPETKIIVISNMDTPKLIKEARDLGVTEYLVKARYTPKDIVTIAEKQLA